MFTFYKFNTEAKIMIYDIFDKMFSPSKITSIMERWSFDLTFINKWIYSISRLYQ